MFIALILKFPVVGIVLGIALIAIGVAFHRTWLGFVGVIPLAYGGYRGWSSLRKR